MNVIERIVQGDQVAFRTFYDHTHKKLFAFALKHLTDFELVEEIVQGVLYNYLEQKNTPLLHYGQFLNLTYLPLFETNVFLNTNVK